MLDLIQNDELLMFQYYWLQKEEAGRFARLGKMLGTYWEYEDVHPPPNSGDSAPQDKCLYPLALAFNSGILDSIKKTLKPPQDVPVADGRDIELSHMGSQDFRNMVRTYVKEIEDDAMSDVNLKGEK